MIGPLFLVQLNVADLTAALRWYEAGLGLQRLEPRTDPMFALLDAGSTRLALKVGNPLVSSILLTFQVADLTIELPRLAARGIVPIGPAQESPEGYRRVRLVDPDGYPVSLFEWLPRGERAS